MARLLQYLFFALIVRPLVYVIMGLNVRRGELLPKAGPAIIVANHNSHLDTLVLMSLLPLRLLPLLRPVAAADYFLRNPLLAWFATRIIGIIPIRRAGSGGNPLSGCFEALARGEILILFPEGSRGEPEQLQETFKQGVRLIARRYPQVPVYPLFLYGLGKALPKGEAMFVPLFCDVFVGEPLTHEGEGDRFFDHLHQAVNRLAAEGELPPWQ